MTTRQEDFERKQQIIIDWFDRIQTFEEWQVFMKFIASAPWPLRVELRTKRALRGRHGDPYSFTEIPWNTKRINYLRDDGFSTGEFVIGNQKRAFSLYFWYSARNDDETALFNIRK